ncbi:MAG: hypothetical protein JWR80_1229 [Bradyrhizobium sp.]|nr:hypothetical protein [Bradyrhizobium sp.]
MKLVVSIACLMLLANCSGKASEAQKLDLKSLRRFEAGFQLPPGSAQLANYARAYALAPQNTALEKVWLWGDVGEGIKLPVNRAYGVGVYSMTGHPSVRTVTIEELPRIVHGGCSVVNIIFEPETGRTIGSWCNGDDPPPLVAHRAG